MKKLIEELYNGNICPQEEMFVHDISYKTYMSKQVYLLEKLRASLTVQQKESLETYLQQENQTNTYIWRKNFCIGFKIGVKLFTETK